MRLVYAQEAVADLARLRDFIAEHDPAAASHISADLISRIDTLCAFPETGRSLSEAPQPDSVREFIFGNHVLRYSMHADALAILRIWHHYEDRQASQHQPDGKTRPDPEAISHETAHVQEQ